MRFRSLFLVLVMCGRLGLIFFGLFSFLGFCSDLADLEDQRQKYAHVEIWKKTFKNGRARFCAVILKGKYPGAFSPFFGYNCYLVRIYALERTESDFGPRSVT